MKTTLRGLVALVRAQDEDEAAIKALSVAVRRVRDVIRRGKRRGSGGGMKKGGAA